MKRILIVEDEKSIAELERDYLEINGFITDIAYAGDEGLRLALSKEYDLILLDVMLPNIDGFEVCKMIRKTKDVPIMLVTAKKDDIDKIRAFGLGADDYVVKPFSPNELIARIKAHLARNERLMAKHRERINSDLYIRGLHIDRSDRRVFVNNRETIFTTKEFDVLTFLATNPEMSVHQIPSS